jgi:TolB-like protein
MNGLLADSTRMRLAGLAVALTLSAGLPAAAQSPARATVAVLPLANASGDVAQNFFAEAMTDELAVALTGVPGLGVVGRSSVFQIKPGNRDIKAIGEALHATHLVQGTAHMVGERVRMNVSLVQASDGAGCGRRTTTRRCPASSMSRR